MNRIKTESRIQLKERIHAGTISLEVGDVHEGLNLNEYRRALKECRIHFYGYKRRVLKDSNCPDTFFLSVLVCR